MSSAIQLRVLLPNRVFLDVARVLRVVLTTDRGSLGVYPRRRDFVAALVPGILTYETSQDGETYLAVDQGFAVKTGSQILVSTQNATRSDGLGQLKQAVQQEFETLTEVDQSTRAALLKLETDMLRRIMEFRT